MKRNGNEQQLVKEIIGREQFIPFWEARYRQTFDKTRPDYEFWDKLRRGKASGYEFGGLFCDPLTEIITSYILGEFVTVAVEDEGADEEAVAATNEYLARLMQYIFGFLPSVIKDWLALGDQYLIVNINDGTISIPSPDTVEPEYDELDYRKLVSITVTTRLDHVVITDKYTDDERVLTIEYVKKVGDQEAGTKSEVRFPNILGRIPVVHFAFGRSGNEVFGHPIYEALLRLFSRYDDLIEKGLDGAELSGNPIPVISRLQDADEVQQENEPIDDEEYTDIDGNMTTRDLINWDTRSALLLGGEATFNFVAPPNGFSGDIREMLKLLFLLIVDHLRIPEALWGGALPYKSGAAEQMKPFFHFIRGLRNQLVGRTEDPVLGVEAKGGLYDLFTILLSWARLTDPRIVEGGLKFKFQALEDVDLDVRLKWVNFLRNMGLLDKIETVAQSGLVDDPAVTVAKAEEEMKESPEFDQFQKDLLEALGVGGKPPAVKTGEAE